MDACREGKSDGPEPRKLFPEVWLSMMR
jgi:hypothetical protein